jgi:hypothetical protein
MKITRIDFAGGDEKAMTFVTVSRRIGSATITASILTPEKHLELSAKAGDRNDLFALATCVQTVLDGGRGATGVIREYFRAIEQMAD